MAISVMQWAGAAIFAGVLLAGYAVNEPDYIYEQSPVFLFLQAIAAITPVLIVISGQLIAASPQPWSHLGLRLGSGAALIFLCYAAWALQLTPGALLLEIKADICAEKLMNVTGGDMSDYRRCQERPTWILMLDLMVYGAVAAGLGTIMRHWTAPAPVIPSKLEAHPVKTRASTPCEGCGAPRTIQDHCRYCGAS